ncbi:uncharacterized protein [Amphiura filiformis]|uniref:uncharacterized protein n=1 Tax=Amphiura filiformis TaxID=82378 RepID=UPI003B21E5B8
MRVYVLILLWLKCAYTVIDDAYLGCFYDAYTAPSGPSNPNLRVLPLGGLRASDMTIGRCINYCVDFQDDIRYVGVEDGNQCFCGTADADYSQNNLGTRPDEECLIKQCVGNENQACGNNFKIAVYDLTLIRCQVPVMHNFQKSVDYVPVQNTVTFECLSSYTLMGTSVVECIFDDSITDTKWATELPVCTPTFTVNESSPNTTPESKIIPPHESDTTVNESSPNTTPESKIIPPHESDTTGIAGATGGAVLFVVCVIVVVVVCFRMKKQRTGPGENTTPVSSGQTQYNNKSDTPFYATVNEEGPVYTTVNKDSYHTPSTHATNGDALNPGNNTIPPIQSPKQQKTVQPYSYTDVTIDSSNVPDIKINERRNDTDNTEESGWAENDLYSRTGDNEEVQEGWNDNSLYATTSQ